MNVLIACLVLCVTVNLASSKSLLPKTIRHDTFRSRDTKHNWVQHGKMPKSYNLDYVDFYPYENLPFRRIKYFDYDIETPLYMKPNRHIPPLVLSSRNTNKQRLQKKKRLEPDAKYEDLFDENGMLFLSRPVDSEDRKLNKLMNKVVEYSMNVKKNKFLRKPLTKVFKPDEIDKLKKIVRALDEEDREQEPVNVRTEYDFSELVQ